MTLPKRQPPFWLAVLAAALTAIALATFYVLVIFVGRTSLVTQVFELFFAPPMFLWMPLILVGVPVPLVEVIVVALEFAYLFLVVWAVWWVVSRRARPGP